MTAPHHAFIDLAVLEPVRERFARAETLAILSPDLETLVWANGAGARLFGHADIDAAMGSAAGLPPIARRQLSALPGFPAIGRNRTVGLRMWHGIGGATAIFEASELRLPGGDAAILLARSGPGDAAQQTTDAIAGFAEAGYFAALVGGDGSVAAQSPMTSAFGFDDEALAELVDAVRGETDRMVKRVVRDDHGNARPVGFARLTDTPALHLLVTLQDVEPEVEDIASPAPTPAEEPRPESPVRDEAPLRFSWQTDAAGRFSAVSAAFAQAVGPAAADILGRSFHDVATVFGIDDEGAIARLMDRRATWSGQTVLWPIEGEARRVPVDLAALPVYDRARDFQGFRGFGVVRPGDAVEDEEGLGLALAGHFVPAAAARIEPTPTAEPQAEDDPFAGELPAIDIAASPGRRAGDKVVVLDEHRPPTQPALSSGERIAFQEIGKRLRTQTETEAGPAADAEEATPPDPDGERRRQERAWFEERIEAELATATARMSPRDEEDDALPANVVRLADAEADGGSRDSTDDEPQLSDDAPDRQAYIPSAFFAASAGMADPVTVLAQMPLPLLVHAGDVLHYANPAFLELTGYGSLDDVAAAGGIGSLFVDEDDMPHPDIKPLPEGALRLRSAQGGEIAVSAHLHSTDWGHGKALMLTVVPRLDAVLAAPPVIDEDAADSEQEKDELRALLTQMQAIIDTATDGVVLIAADGTIRTLSRPAEALFGIDGDTVEGEPFTSLFAIESQRVAGDYIARLSQTGVASVLNDGCEVIGREAEGGFIPLFMTIGRLPQEGGFCAVLRDITPWKRAEEELTHARTQAERASSQKTEFLARISHEIRTPLNAIIGFSELMINESFGPIGTERYRDYLRDINRSGSHVLDLVNDLLDISKIEAGEQEMNYEAVSLNDTLGEAVAMMQPQANRERVIIRSSFASTLPEVVADLRSIRQIALNLLSNAVRYTPAGGQVIVSTAQELDGDIVLRVRDTGIGMTPSEIDQAMKPFKRVNALKRSQREGTGLGLPLTKAMVEANRARFAISSTPDQGTLVEITFPSTRVLAE